MSVTVFIEGVCAGPEGALPTFEAAAVGEPWNGWATPVITREQFVPFAEWVWTWGEETNVCVMPEGIYVQEPEEEAVLCPVVEGGYSLAPLGWVFEVAEREAVGA